MGVCIVKYLKSDDLAKIEKEQKESFLKSVPLVCFYIFIKHSQMCTKYKNAYFSFTCLTVSY